MKNLRKKIRTVVGGLVLATTLSSSANLAQWRFDEENNLKIDTVTQIGEKVSSWNSTPFYGDSVEYLLLGRNNSKKDYFGMSLLDFFNVNIDGVNGVTDYLITLTGYKFGWNYGLYCSIFS